MRYFDRFGEILGFDHLLTHYDPRREIIVSAGASAIVVGATVSHRFSNGFSTSVTSVCKGGNGLQPVPSSGIVLNGNPRSLITSISIFSRMGMPEMLVSGNGTQ